MKYRKGFATSFHFSSIQSDTCVIFYDEPGCKGQKALIEKGSKCSEAVGNCSKNMKSTPKSIKKCDARHKCLIRRKEQVTFYIDPQFSGVKFTLEIEEDNCYAFAKFPKSFRSLKSDTGVIIYGESECETNGTRIFSYDEICLEDVDKCFESRGYFKQTAYSKPTALSTLRSVMFVVLLIYLI